MAHQDPPLANAVPLPAPAQPNAASPIPMWLVPAAFFIGIAFLVAILVLVLKIPNPTEFQFIVFRIVIALGGAAFSMALTGFLTIQMNLPNGGQIVAGGALAVFIVLFFFSPKIPGIPKPLVDNRGDLLESPANKAGLEVIRLQDEIGDLRQYLESVQYPASRAQLEKADRLAESILSFNDSGLNARRRYIKYQYAAYAYVDAAAGAMYDKNSPKVQEFASKAKEAADTALSILNSAKSTYSSNPDSSFLIDWVNKDEGEDRVLYLRTMAACMLGTMRGDATLESGASETWEKIHASYRAKFPAAGTPQMSSCVRSS